jgi:hypothetical protein
MPRHILHWVGGGAGRRIARNSFPVTLAFLVKLETRSSPKREDAKGCAVGWKI